jgi:hypothetical protein
MPTTQHSLSWPVSPELVAQIETAIRKQRARNPFLPIHVIVPNHVLATLLERALFEDAGYVAVHIELAHEFAWRVAGRRAVADGLLPIPEEVDLAIVLSAAAVSVTEATPDYLKRAVQMSGFAPAALRTLRDIAAAGVMPARASRLPATAWWSHST